MVWYHDDIAKSNLYCLYCSELVGLGSIGESTKEHTIGRNFVPKGSFGDGTAFNFIFRACNVCNGLKADIERHVSSVTLFNSPARVDDPAINSIAQHKASKDYHPDKKGILVQDADNKISVNFGGVFNFDIVAPPQLNQEHVIQLARYHVQAIFSMITTLDPLDRDKVCLLHPEKLLVFNSYSYEDWGNPELKEVAERVKDWPCYAIINTANGFFRAIMKRKGADGDGWFWALEWNKSVRVIGAIYLPNQTPGVFQDLPDIGWSSSKTSDGEILRTRTQTPYNIDDDILFDGIVVVNE